MVDFEVKQGHMLTQAEKDANDFYWYKERARELRQHLSYNNIGFGGVSDYNRKKVNYDLFNNIVDMSEFRHVCKPYGSDVGELPAKLSNRDISSGKIKVLLGMEMKMPFSYKVSAINPEATTEREEAEFNRITDFVTSSIMKPIREEIIRNNAQQTKGRELSEEDIMQIQQSIESEVESKTPDKIRRYMSREFQSPVEVLGQQLLQYLTTTQKSKFKFSKGWKHACLVGEEIYYVGILGGEPIMETVNALHFTCADTPEIDFIEDREWATRDMFLTPSQIIKYFGKELTDTQIEKIYDRAGFGSGNPMYDTDFSFIDIEGGPGTVRVTHCVFKSLRKAGFLLSIDAETGLPVEDVVDENYRLQRRNGDISLKWEWIPETHEVYMIDDDVFVGCGPVAGQHRNLDNLYDCKLSYYGAVYDNMNSPVTAPMDRLKNLQYLYNIIIYRIELLMASDKGKKFAMNMGSIPESMGIDINKMLYFLDANNILFLNPNEEGLKNKGADVTNLIKEIDMSTVSSIDRYIGLAEYIKREAGASVGVTPQMEAQISPNEAVRNTQQNLIQSSHIVQPYFEMHNMVKGNVLQALLNSAIVAYSEGPPKILSYVLDDLSVELLRINPEVLSYVTYLLYVTSSSDAYDAKQMIINLSQAAMQNQQASISDLVTILESQSILEAKETLKLSESKKQAQLENLEKIKNQGIERQMQMAESAKDADHDREKELVVLKEEEKRKTLVQVQAMESMGFDPEKDQDRDGVPDVLEVAKFGVDADIRRKQLALDQEKFEHDKKVDTKKMEQEDKKLKIQARKNTKE